MAAISALLCDTCGIVIDRSIVRRDQVAVLVAPGCTTRIPTKPPSSLKEIDELQLPIQYQHDTASEDEKLAVKLLLCFAGAMKFSGQVKNCVTSPLLHAREAGPCTVHAASSLGVYHLPSRPQWLHANSYSQRKAEAICGMHGCAAALWPDADDTVLLNTGRFTVETRVQLRLSRSLYAELLCSDCATSVRVRLLRALWKYIERPLLWTVHLCANSGV